MQPSGVDEKSKSNTEVWTCAACSYLEDNFLFYSQHDILYTCPYLLTRGFVKLLRTSLHMKRKQEIVVKQESMETFTSPEDQKRAQTCVADRMAALAPRNSPAASLPLAELKEALPAALVASFSCWDQRPISIIA